LVVGCASDEAVQKGTGAHEETVVEAKAPTNQPNIIFVLTDDLDYNSAQLMPNVRSQLIDKGTTFENDFVGNSLCCPSRATILTGLYAHNHDVEYNNPPRGGFERFVAGGYEQKTIAYRLEQDGYTTGLYGKYLNHYPGNDDPTRVPPGWDEWHAWGDTLGQAGDENSANTGATESNAAYYNYELNENGKIVSYGDSSDDYMTDVLSSKAQDFVRNTASDSKPFFLYLATSAPHGPPVPAERHKDVFASVTAPRSPSFNQEDVSSMPPWIRDMSRFSVQDTIGIDTLYRLRMGSMLAVDGMVDSVVKELEADGQLDNTFIFFTSDNGLLLGQHRIKNDKRYPYEEAIRTPLFVRGPGVPARSKVENLVINTDFAPTFAELAGVPFPSDEQLDGRSLASLLRGENPPWRSGILLEWFGQTNKRRQLPAYEGIRTDTYKYVEYDSGDRELYDLKADPYEVNNIYESADPSLLEDLKTRLEALRSCTGEGCQQAEDAS
jgi:N-acetylglucosamine-6-sulfatase